MSDTTSPDQSGALNSFSVGSALGSIWDTATNTFKATVHSVENAFLGGALAAQAAAQANAQQQSQYVPTVQVQGALSTNTMIFIGLGLAAVLLLARK